MKADTTGALTTADGRRVRWFDTGGAAGAPVLVWHHGTPQTGAVIAPVAAAASARGLRVVSCARPGYPGSDPLPGRTVADAAADVVAVLDELDVREVIAAGASGGGPHALALAAVAPDRVRAAVVLAGIAPYTASPDWFTGMADPSGLGAALSGRDARLAHAQTAEFDPDSFTARDYEALNGDWGPLGADAGAGSADGPDGEVDDDVAYVTPWGVDLAAVRCPALLVQGGADRVVPPGHAALQLARLHRGELWLRPREGHISVLTGLGVALDWALSR
ncbi:alpha/beta hydrolase [Leifsonia sp. ZF2019]|uniref:alpha/beta fold hydrolase n=1 Tax=Leifsonia sp. ZF2019 TaxID=2781978 RepID=UPI001CC0CF09|nr:alpha/beta hydrolase [Leifsonia sp. ZF2019]UAJ80999.1 alpha/beta hydrolase [Leifsonia sp. ZF2019]